MASAEQTPIIRAATTADIPALSALGARTFTETFGADNTPDDLAEFLRVTWAPSIQADEFADPALHYLVADAAGELVAFALLRTGDAPACVPDGNAVELKRIYVVQSLHGSGLAQRLLAAAIAAAHAHSSSAMYLGVWERNARAIQFYQRQGFSAVGDTIFTVGSDPQRDIVMYRPFSATDRRT